MVRKKQEIRVKPITDRQSPRSSLGRLSKLAVFLGAVVAVIASYMAVHLIQEPAEVHRQPDVRALVHSEELTLELTPRLKGLATSLLNLRFPDHHSYPLLEDQINVIDLESGAEPAATDTLVTGGITSRSWPVESQGRYVSSKQLKLWRGLLDAVDHFAHAKFYFIRGQFSDANRTVFEADVGFAGLAFMKNGKWRAVKAKQTVHWRREPAASANVGPIWRIFVWHTAGLETTDSDRLLFDEVLNHALPDRHARRRARKSHQVDYVVEWARTGRVGLENQRYQRYFAQRTTGQHPGLAVADVDGDGWDDLYVMVPWGRNQLLHNQGDGTFVERAAAMGLDIDGVSTSGIFADFDNDGDKDLMLGRSLERSMYLVNNGGRFEDRSSSLVSLPLPYLVASVSAADYNGDGLLDVYLSTYWFGIAKFTENWAPEFLPAEQAREIIRRDKDPESDHHPFVNRLGPPNLLLVGRGEGRFELAPENEQVALSHNSFQATWADFDEDGDPDLYVSNDYAPDFLFRNDGVGGFVDITMEAGGPTMLGFGMGASWGDYDNDGRQDLYISNMYSKAGMRITAQVPDLDARFRRSADGNRLYRYLGDRFELVSGSQPPALRVTQAGWSWGGQFVDLDNDGFLDIYVTSGYDTSPEEVASDVDL